MILRDFSKFVLDENGQSLVETSLIYLFVAIAVTISLVAFGETLLVRYLDNAEKISSVNK